MESLKVVILYEDFATGLRAKSILDRMMNRLDTETECHNDWCRLDMLRQAVFRMEIMRKVAEVDILVASAHGDSKPFAELERWLEEWVHRRANRAGALVLSLDAGAKDTDPGRRTLLRFRVIAAKTGLVLFSHFEDPPIPGSGVATGEPYPGNNEIAALELRSQ